MSEKKQCKQNDRKLSTTEATLGNDNIWIWSATLPWAVLLAEAALVAGDAGVAALVGMVMGVAGMTD